MDVSNSTTIRINITVPRWLVGELEREVPERGKSGFISEAIEEKLVRKKRDKALKEVANLPPTFKDIADGKEYINKIRKAEDVLRRTRLGL